MPRRVDHEERRQQIADAVCRLLGRSGPEAVSLRHVAAEAGVSMGRVQHYFSTKEEMLLFAFRTLSARVEARIGAAVADAGSPPRPRVVLRALLTQMLPLGEQGRLEAPVWVAFLGKAVVEPGLAAPFADDGRRLVEFVAGQIRAAQEAGAADPELDPTHEARALLALVDGLMLHVLVGQADEATATATLDRQLDRILPPG